jgi:3-oxoacyl-[acyl-carrier protein] reductase
MGVSAPRGHDVLATDLDVDALAIAAERDQWSAARVIRRKLDVRSEAEWEATLAAADSDLGGIDVLFNIAGQLEAAYVQDFTQRELDLQLDVNAKGTMLGTRAAARRMIKASSGHIVNVGSLASLTAVPGLSLYSASKFAVRGFTLAVAAELAPHGVAVTLILPDAVETPMLQRQLDRVAAAFTFSGSRPLHVEDVAAVIVDRVLPDKPLEVTIPASRGLLARLANTAPALFKRVVPRLLAKGRKRQEALKRAKKV